MAAQARYGERGVVAAGEFEHLLRQLIEETEVLLQAGVELAVIEAIL
jgi:hypothetical protein